MKLHTSDLYTINLPDNWYSQENPEAECTIFYAEGGEGVLWLKAFKLSVAITDNHLLEFIERDLQPSQSIAPVQVGPLRGYSYLESTPDRYQKTWVLRLEHIMIYASFTAEPPVDSDEEVGEANNILASMATL